MSIKTVSIFWRCCFAMILIAGGGFAGVARAQNLDADFTAANKLYEQQKYSEAATAYEKLLLGGQVSASLYFNLGNACFKAGNFGKAIAAYRNAERIAPRDPNIRANLQFARNEANSKYTETAWQQWLGRMTVNEWTVLALVCFWLFFALLIVGHWRPEWKRGLRLYATLLGAAFCFVSICLGFVINQTVLKHYAVVATQEAVVRRGPLDESQSAFSLRDGAELLLLDRRNDWLQIADNANRSGWVKEGDVIVLK